MEVSTKKAAKLASAALALMDEKISVEDRDAFTSSLGKHLEALAMIGVGGGGVGSTCRITRIYISCPVVVRGGGVSPMFAQVAQSQGKGPIRWGGGSCVPIPGTNCFFCYEYECSPA